MPRVSLLLFFEIVSFVGSVLTVFKLFKTGLYRRYPFFFTYFIFRIAYQSGVLSLDVRSQAYYKFWLYGNPAYWILWLLVIRELSGRIFENYKGLRTLGRWIMYGGTAIALSVSFGTLLVKTGTALSKRSRTMAYVANIDRGVTVFFVIFLLVILFLVSRYPMRLPRNVVIHSFIFGTFFLCSSLTMLLRTMFGIRDIGVIDTGFVAVGAACSLAWFWLLTPQGEEVTTPVLHLKPAREEHLLAQLNALNSTLIKAGKH